VSKTLLALILRHGESDANATGVFRSRLDSCLTDNGISQAEKAAAFIAKNFDVKRIVSSPMLRAMQTADIVSEEIGIEVIQDRGLMCWNLGFLSGRDREVYGHILEYYVDNPEQVIPEGESLEYFTTRTQDFFEKNLFLKESTGGKHEVQHENASGPWTYYGEDALQELILFVCHTSNLVCLENIVVENPEGRPESGEAAVGTGGMAAIYADGEDIIVEPIFGESHRAEFGS